MKRYKLTDANNRTYGDTLWGANVTHTATGEGKLCGPGWIHVYDSPLLAVLLNPIHGNFVTPRLWECECDGVEKTNLGLKFGYTSVTTLREIPLPLVTTEQRVRFGILCGLQVPHSQQFRDWSESWLNGSDRSVASAEATAKAVAAWAAEAARAAAWAAKATKATANAAAEAAEKAASWAASAAVWAAQVPADGFSTKPFDLIGLAEQAMNEPTL